MNLEQKIVDISQIGEQLVPLRAAGKKIVQCHGVFDLLHPGHFAHLETARRSGDVLVVSVTTDRFVNKGPGRPAFKAELRAKSLAALQVVDYVVLSDSASAIEAINAIRPDIYVKGNDYSDHSKDSTGKITAEVKAVRSHGGDVLYTDEVTFSSTRLLNSYFDVLPENVRTWLGENRGRHSFEEITGLINQLSGLNVLVVGDAIIDEYVFCTVFGKSTKSPSLNARILDTETYAGGSLAVANHLSGFCASVDLLTCLGEQSTHEDFINANLESNVHPTFVVRPDGPTTLKRRFVERFRSSKLFEITDIEDRPVPAETNLALRKEFERLAEKADLIVVCDYGHGMIDEEFARTISSTGKFLALNVQTNSANVGFNLITKYPRANYVCIDKVELQLAYHKKAVDVLELAQKGAADLSADMFVVTLGGDGARLIANGEVTAVPAFSRDVIDSVGAGDAFFAVTAPCVALGFKPEVIGVIGNAVGGMAIRIMGNSEFIKPAPLLRYIEHLLK